jgi:hypothetical protein
VARRQRVTHHVGRRVRAAHHPRAPVLRILAGHIVAAVRIPAASDCPALARHV